MTAEEMFAKLGYDEYDENFCGIRNLFYERRESFGEITIIKFTEESVNIRRSRGSSIWLSAETIKAIDKQLDELKEESAEP